MKLDLALRRFFESASALRLTDGEKSVVRTALTARMALHLTSAERAQSRDALVSYMRAHPLPEKPPSWLEALHSLLFSRAPAFAMSAIIVVVGGGIAVASAAESALPGDPLYTVKVEVMEPLRERMLRTPEQRMAWKVRKVERRLAEARSLLRGDNLTESRRGLIEGSIAREVRALQVAEQGMDEEMVIASQQVLEETMENAVTADRDRGSEHPQWRHLKTFVRARRSDVHTTVRERMQTAYGTTDNVAPAAASVPTLMALPVPVLTVEKEEIPLMMQTKQSSEAEEDIASSERSVQQRDVSQEPERRKRKKSSAAPEQSASARFAVPQEGLEDDQGEESEEEGLAEAEAVAGEPVEELPFLDVPATSQESQILPISAPIQVDVETDHDEQAPEEKGHEQALERLKEKREDIERQLRGFRESEGLLP